MKMKTKKISIKDDVINLHPLTQAITQQDCVTINNNQAIDELSVKELQQLACAIDLHVIKTGEHNYQQLQGNTLFSTLQRHPGFSRLTLPAKVYEFDNEDELISFIGTLLVYLPAIEHNRHWRFASNLCQRYRKLESLSSHFPPKSFFSHLAGLSRSALRF